ncbi:SoxR reducing system RseC family protein [Desulfonema magnum]|uniref:Transcriptional regulator, ResC family n=1 Tax=Desulfonema magnum TaxID=45655 RepID=A0A975BW03_9BACT|nr:SoxR reducing system RseC family protein [Desulfonema magnum]QTA92407.1 Putative transcriptional regulator, ResC family [Desulfonema magnum]
MATEEGIVIKVSNSGTAWVKTTKSSSCEACAARDSCHSMGGGKEMKVETINTAGAKVGDKVIIGFETASLLKAAFLVYVFPILSMIAGAVIGQEVAPNYNFSAPYASVTLGFMFFFLAFLLVRIMGIKMSKKEEYRAKIIRIKRGKKTEDLSEVA